MHAWVKRTKEEAETCVTREGLQSASPSDIVEEDFKGWTKVWGRLQQWATTPWRSEEADKKCEEVEGLPNFGAKELRRACQSFSERTGWGTDNIGPRQLSWLSDDLLEVIAVLLMNMEKRGIWPMQLREAFIHLIPKPTGGRRPIGIVTSLPRIWERVRKPALIQWRLQFVRDFNWMTAGRGAARAVWAQSVEEEAARYEGKKTTAVLIDLVKAFEQVDLGSVWAAGRGGGLSNTHIEIGNGALCLRQKARVQEGCEP